MGPVAVAVAVLVLVAVEEPPGGRRFILGFPQSVQRRVAKAKTSRDFMKILLIGERRV